MLLHDVHEFIEIYVLTSSYTLSNGGTCHDHIGAHMLF